MSNLRNFVVGALLCCLSTIVYAGCEEVRVFDQASRMSIPALTENRALSAQEQSGLGAALDRLNAGEVRSILTQNSLSIYSGFLTGMLDKLARFQDLTLASDLALRASDVRFALQIFDELCLLETDTQDRLNDARDQKELRPITFTFSGYFQPAGSPDVSAYLNLSLVFFLLLGLISLITLIWKICAISRQFMAQRKICKIPITLKLGEMSIVGYITLLDKRAARLVAEEQYDFDVFVDHLKQLADLPKSRLVLNGTEYPTRFFAITEKACVVRFETMLARAALNAMLASSLELTRDAERTTIEPNMHSINPKFA